MYVFRTCKPVQNELYYSDISNIYTFENQNIVTPLPCSCRKVYCGIFMAFITWKVHEFAKFLFIGGKTFITPNFRTKLWDHCCKVFYNRFISHVFSSITFTFGCCLTTYFFPYMYTIPIISHLISMDGHKLGRLKKCYFLYYFTILNIVTWFYPRSR